ncbi:uracil-DNA glycosylase [Niabella drilacis]|uniref:Uracil-DNA glycosylase n=1 Tax=Niabella drilacis (strain DSM 25811 / CCM 8410 / CCUG 62505 / LMG 26954 / E90) TaxID=1285928 RepID=A0A1G6INF7_NIADE|nr:uracil-DNA glycosylase [Niabella drilacis]SDC07983.1 Uracil-DNA glycosylase [Niabella drilacis]
MEVAIEDSWKKELEEEFQKPYFESLVQHLKTEKQAGKIIYPAGKNIFNAFNTTPFDHVKVLLLGQDPYHGPGQAHGLCFSVQKGVPPPPSLVNIYKELKADLGVPIPASGDLTHWAQQGVFMLNASLTVRAGEPMSHSKIGWATFTDAVIRKVSEHKTHVVFILWGKFAQEKASLIDASKHLILRSAHPSPLSAHNGFLGSRPFSKTNEYLAAHGIDPIDWKVDAV